MKRWKNNRPDGWDNPYSDGKVEYLDRASLICKMKDGTCIPNLIREAREHTFEAGADALFKAVIEWLKENNHGGEVLMISAEKWQELLKEAGL